MIDLAKRPLTHITAWIAWHSMRVSLIDDHPRSGSSR
jgi:hypothetical protein